jgi:hypothetical protein
MALKNKIMIAVVFLIVVLAGVSFYGTVETEERLNSLIKEYKLDNSVKYESVFFNPLTFSPTISGVEFAAKQPIRFDAVTLHNYQADMKQGIVNLALSYDLATMPLQHAPDNVKELLFDAALHGLDKFDSHGQVAIQLVDGDMHINLNAGIDDFSDIELSFVGEYDESYFKNAMSQFAKNGFWALFMLQRGASEAVALANFELYLDTGEYLQKTIQYEKEQHYFSEKTFKAELEKAIIEAGLAESGSDEMDEIMAECVDFIESPGRLELSISPDKPISIQDYVRLMQERNIYRKLNMDIAG